jgi:hypothetical protein
MVYASRITDQLNDVLASVVNVGVKVIIFLAIMALGWIVGRWIYKSLGALLRRVGFDRGVERGGLNRILGESKASDVTARLVELAFLLFVLQLAFGIFGPNPVSDLIHAVVAWLPKLFVAVIIIVVAAALAGWVKEIIKRSLGGLSYASAIGTSAQAVILGLGLIAAVNQVGVAESVTLPVLIAFLAIVAGIAIVGVGGGLVRPMQARWERILNRAEAESTVAAEKMRAHRSTMAERNRNERSQFDQPAYGGSMPSDTKPPADTSTLSEEERNQRGTE